MWVCASLPVPPHNGERLIAYQLLLRLRSKHHVTLVSFWDQKQDEPHLNDVRELCDELHLIPRPHRYWHVFDQAASLLDPLPRWVRVCASASMRAALTTLKSSQVFDAAHIATGPMAQYLDSVRPIPTLCAPYDSLTLALEERARSEPHGARRAYWQLQSRKMRLFEAQRYAQADKTYVVSTRDAEFLLGLNACADITVIPNGVDTEYFAPMNLPDESPSVALTGVMDYPPNELAALWFAREVLPLLWKECAELKFWIVGRNPTPEIRALAAEERIRVTGYVEDMRPMLARSTVVVCPIRESGGIKNKVLEAMAMAKPVVASSRAAESMAARPNEDLLIADTPSDTAQAVLALLNDPARRRTIGQNGRLYVEKSHDWDRTATSVEELYLEAQSKARRRHASGTT